MSTRKHSVEASADSVGHCINVMGPAVEELKQPYRIQLLIAKNEVSHIFNSSCSRGGSSSGC